MTFNVIMLLHDGVAASGRYMRRKGRRILAIMSNIIFHADIDAEIKDHRKYCDSASKWNREETKSSIEKIVEEAWCCCRMDSRVTVQIRRESLYAQ